MSFYFIKLKVHIAARISAKNSSNVQSFYFHFLISPKNVYFISVAPRHEYLGVEKRIWLGMSISNHWLRKWIKGFCWYQYRDNITLTHELRSYKIRLSKLSLICPTMLHLPTLSKKSDGLPYLKSSLYIDTLPLLSTSTELVDHNFKILRNSDIHSYNTRRRNDFRLPLVKMNYGKQRLFYQCAMKWNVLDASFKEINSLLLFKQSIKVIP